MLQDPLTLYKLIVLYMLNRVTFPLTAAQVSDFILGKEYTNFLTLQQVINELTDAGMIATHSIRNRTHLSITAEGQETLNFFENRIGDTIKQEIDSLFAGETSSHCEMKSLSSEIIINPLPVNTRLIWLQKTEVSTGRHHICPSRGRNCGSLSATTGRKKIRKYTNT